MFIDGIKAALVKQVYQVFIRNYFYKKAKESTNKVDDFVLKAIDQLLGIN
jgi:hypothetical protein